MLGATAGVRATAGRREETQGPRGDWIFIIRLLSTPTAQLVRRIPPILAPSCGGWGLGGGVSVGGRGW